MKKEISSVKNWKEGFWQPALCSVNSSHRVTSFPPRILSLSLFLWNSQGDIWKAIEAYGGKNSILRWKLERRFLKYCFVMCDFQSLSYSCILWSCVAALFLWNLRTDISDPFEGLRAKGNILRSKWERRFPRNFFAICEFISQSYRFPLKKLFAKTVLVEFKSDIWKPMEGFGVLLIHLPELQLSPQEDFG